MVVLIYESDYVLRINGEKLESPIIRYKYAIYGVRKSLLCDGVDDC